MAAGNRAELDNEFFQERFVRFFSMLLQTEETLLEGYEETLASLAKE